MTPARVLKSLRARLFPVPTYPQWSRVLMRDGRRWRQAIDDSKEGPRILIATSFGGHLPSVHLETTLAVALTLRGANVHLLLCDSVLPACQLAEFAMFDDPREFIEEGPQGRLCQQCFAPAAPVFNSLGLTVHTYRQWLDTDDGAEVADLVRSTPQDGIEHLKVDGLAVGEHATAGALRFFARGNISEEEHAESVLARYLEAALLTVRGIRNLLRTEDIEIACFNHGIYVPQGLIAETARQEGTRVVTWNPAYRKGCFIFSHGDTYHHTLLDEPVEVWQDQEWSDQKEREVVEYLESRRTGTRDWIWFHERPEEQLDVIQEALGIDLSKPTIGLLTNVIWDAQLHYRANAFGSMMEWILATIDYFALRTELQLVIRVHPAEIRGTVPSRQRVTDEIGRLRGSCPANVFVIPPESPVSTYAVMDRCNAVLIYGTKTGVELSARGTPVIVGGEAWIRNKGLTMDAASPEEYLALLDRLPLAGRLDDATITRARKYAYHFFFRRMIPIVAMKPTGEWPPYRMSVKTLAELTPGRDRGLDVVCDGILNAQPFVF